MLSEAVALVLATARADEAAARVRRETLERELLACGAPAPALPPALLEKRRRQRPPTRPRVRPEDNATVTSLTDRRVAEAAGRKGAVLR